jgi:hypothetical protein
MKLSSPALLLLSAAYWMDLARDYVRLAIIDSECRNKWLVTARSSVASARRMLSVWVNNSILAA